MKDGNEERPGKNVTAAISCCRYVNLKVENREAEFLVDSGSVTTLISKKLFNSFGSPKPKLHKNFRRLDAANGGAMNILGTSVVKIQLLEKIYEHEVYVAELGDVDGILGIDFFDVHDLDLSVRKNFIITPEGNVSMHREKPNSTCARITVSERVEIPANSEKIVSGVFERNTWKGGKEGILEPLENFVENTRLLMPGALVSANTKMLPLAVTNTTSESIILEQGMAVALLQPVKCVSAAINTELTKCNFE